jgi:hypothetical protein
MAVLNKAVRLSIEQITIPDKFVSGKISEREHEHLMEIARFRDGAHFGDIALDVINGFVLGTLKREDLPEVANVLRIPNDDIGHRFLEGVAAGEFVGYARMIVTIAKRLGDPFGYDIVSLGLAYRIDPRDLERIETLCLEDHTDIELQKLVLAEIT